MGLRCSVLVSAAGLFLGATGCWPAFPDDGDAPRVYEDVSWLPADTSATSGPTMSCGSKIDCRPIIEVHDAADHSISNATVIPVETGDLPLNATRVMKYTITNSGNGVLMVSKIDLSYAAASPLEDEPAFSCTLDDGQTPCAGYKFPPINPPGYGGTTAIHFQIQFLNKYDDHLQRKAILHILSNDKSASYATDIEVAFLTLAGQPKLKVQPADMDFAFVPIGATKNGEAQLFSIGDADLTICDIDLTTLPAAFFTLVLDLKEHPGGSDVKLDPCRVLKAGESMKIQLAYKGVDDKPHTGAIVLHTNDSSLPAGNQTIKVKVNSAP